MKRTIYINKQAQAIIGETDNLSGRITDILYTYSSLLSASTPELPLSDWLALADIIGRNKAGVSPVNYQLLAVLTSSDMPSDLSTKVRHLPVSSIYAITDIVNRFHLSAADGDVSERLADSGARISGVRINA